MFMYRQQNDEEQNRNVAKLKLLTSQNYIHEEIKSTLILGNTFYHYVKVKGKVVHVLN
jgi:hypothetical protein